MAVTASSNRAFFNQLRKYYTWYTGGFIVFLVVLAVLEQMGLPKVWIGYVFLFATIGLYAGIGIMARTADVAEYYVAGRRVPAFFNGMATGADWMSAASFIGMAGGLYLQGFDGLAFIMGWTGGYCLVALFLAPYLRKFGQFTIPDFLGARYGGNVARSIGVFAAILCSFTYVIAQIYGVGLITSRFTGVEFGVGVFLGLAGILVCSFLGGMNSAGRRPCKAGIGSSSQLATHCAASKPSESPDCSTRVCACPTSRARPSTRELSTGVKILLSRTFRSTVARGRPSVVNSRSFVMPMRSATLTNARAGMPALIASTACSGASV